MTKEIEGRSIAWTVLAVAMLIMTDTVSAQNIAVDPSSWDFGDIELASSETKSIRITSTEPIPLTISQIAFTGDSSLSFFIDGFLLDGVTPIASVPPSVQLFPLSFLDILVRFTPDSLGLHTASIRIESDAEPPNDLLLVPLTGTSVTSTSVPEPSILALLGIGLAGMGFARRRRNRTQCAS